MVLLSSGFHFTIEKSADSLTVAPLRAVFFQGTLLDLNILSLSRTTILLIYFCLAVTRLFESVDWYLILNLKNSQPLLILNFPLLFFLLSVWNSNKMYYRSSSAHLILIAAFSFFIFSLLNDIFLLSQFIFLLCFIYSVIGFTFWLLQFLEVPFSSFKDLLCYFVWILVPCSYLKMCCSLL